jgi:hypothetical protein
MKYPALFKNFSGLRGKDWLRSLPDEDRKAFSWIGIKESGFGRLGGKARAAQAKRDSRGRFLKGGKGAR